MWREWGHLPWLRNVGEVRVWAGCGRGAGGRREGRGRERVTKHIQRRRMAIIPIVGSAAT